MPVVLAGLCLAPVRFGADDEAVAPTQVRSVRDGVYTQAQAERGKKVYLAHCVECHKEDLRGDQQMTPSLVGIGFAFRWKDKKLYGYFVGMHRSDTMPQSAPGIAFAAAVRRVRLRPSHTDLVGNNRRRSPALRQSAPLALAFVPCEASCHQ